MGCGHLYSKLFLFRWKFVHLDMKFYDDFIIFQIRFLYRKIDNVDNNIIIDDILCGLIQFIWTVTFAVRCGIDYMCFYSVLTETSNAKIGTIGQKSYSKLRKYTLSIQEKIFCFFFQKNTKILSFLNFHEKNRKLRNIERKNHKINIKSNLLANDLLWGD